MATATNTTTKAAPPSMSPSTTLLLRAQDSASSTMATASAPGQNSADTLTCRACRRTLATVSAAGDLEPHGVLDEGCDLCKDMLMHYNEYEEAKECFKELEHRRDDYRPRQLALEVVHEAQKNLGNFLGAAVAWDDPDDDGDAAPGEQIEAQTEEIAPAAGTAAGVATPLRRKHSRSPHSSPGPRKLAKRLRLLERTRRVSFDPSVVFRDAEAESKRVDAEFSRNSEGYSPGRWAAPKGSEWLDTSGSSVKETKFFGVAKRGQKWVPTKEGLEMDEEWQQARMEEGTEEEGEGGVGGDGGGEETEEDVRVEKGVKEWEAEPSASDIVLSDARGPPELNASEQDSAPLVEPFSQGATRANVEIDEDYSAMEDEATDEAQLPATRSNPTSAKEEPSPDGEHLLEVGTDETD